MIDLKQILIDLKKDASAKNIRQLLNDHSLMSALEDRFVKESSEEKLSDDLKSFMDIVFGLYMKANDLADWPVTAKQRERLTRERWQENIKFGYDRLPKRDKNGPISKIKDKLDEKKGALLDRYRYPDGKTVDTVNYPRLLPWEVRRIKQAKKLWALGVKEILNKGISKKTSAAIKKLYGLDIFAGFKLARVLHERRKALLASQLFARKIHPPFTKAEARDFLISHELNKGKMTGSKVSNHTLKMYEDILYGKYDRMVELFERKALRLPNTENVIILENVLAQWCLELAEAFDILKQLWKDKDKAYQGLKNLDKARVVNADIIASNITLDNLW